MTDIEKSFWQEASWPAPPRIRAGTTTRLQGLSRSPYESFNLAEHVGDDREDVAANRSLLRQGLSLPSSPLWLKQVHGARITNEKEWHKEIEADACCTNQADVVCAVLSADCLPLLLCDNKGLQIGALHLGWRGVAAGLIESSIENFSCDVVNLIAWIGPHIRQQHYEIGTDVYDIFQNRDPGTDRAFIPDGKGKWQLSLAQLVNYELEKCGISQIYDCQACTYAEPLHFFSYRRQAITGRMATLIWIDSTGI
ncbi:MAG: peptidoglycan editing factor PgeF [Gammaproteobacteria bacterium]|nr:peptidoglycan editing factor PgeF [Gammaproteobacteria bacterium]